MATALDPALTVRCPVCGAGVGEVCRSRHAVRIHAARRAVLRNLEAEATRLIRQNRGRR